MTGPVANDTGPGGRTSGYCQSQFRVSVYKQVGRPHDSQKRQEDLPKVTNAFMEQYTLPTDTNQLPNVPSRNDVETWWLTNEQTRSICVLNMTGLLMYDVHSSERLGRVTPSV
jgi:hypothetical protein